MSFITIEIYLLITFYKKHYFYVYPGSTWENCVIELEQTGTPGEVDFGTISVFGTKKHKVIG